MIYSGRKNCASKDVAYALSATKVMCSWLTVSADRGNAGLVYVGGVDETTKACAIKTGATLVYVGHPLAPPAAATNGTDFVNFREIGGPAYIDLSQVYVVSDTDNDGVTFNYGRR
jgi:hypothetical protein